MKRILSLFLTLALLLPCLAYIPAASLVTENAPVPEEGMVAITAISSELSDLELYLHIGSPIALSNGQILPLDPNNPGLVPVIHKSRTLVPLRMISEYFGAVVDYDDTNRTALLNVGGKEASFPIGKNYFTLDGQKVDLDTETLLISGRTFVPLRVICEQVLGMHVDYRDSVIYIAQSAALSDTTVQDVKSKIGMFLKVPSLSALKKALAASNDSKGVDGERDQGESGVIDEIPPISAPSEMPQTDDSAAAGESGYSSTNTQVEGVDEGDIIKTDGQYIYIVANNLLKIVKADKGKMTQVASVSLGDNVYASEMYIDKGRVVVVGSRWEYSNGTGEGARFADDYYYWGWSKNYASLTVFDTSDITAPQILRSYEIEGSYASSRKQGSNVYLVTNHYSWADNSDPRPLVREGAKSYALPLDCIMLAQGSDNQEFLTITALDIADASVPVASESITGSGYVTYMSNSALYIAMPKYDYANDKSTLSIARFSVNGSKIGYMGSGTVEGNVDDQFSMDENNGYLRIATTLWWPEAKNNLYILDGNMDVCGSVLGFAPDESIYSARFMGNRGYVVTFRQVDPLFVFDLSDPNNPAIVGQLKVPGFSSYLHPVSENVLLGVGRDVYDIYRRDRNGNEVVVGQQTGGLKISLFDVSDAGVPKELDTLILGEASAYSPLLYNHKAAMFKTDESLLAFPAELYDEGWETSFNGALLISYKNNKLTERGRIEAEDLYGSDDWGNVLSTEQRLVYIGSTLYYLQDGLLSSYDLAGLNQIASLNLTV